MLRVHIAQPCYNLSDPAMGDLPYEPGSVRRFAGLRLREAIPGEITILHLRHCWIGTAWDGDCLKKSRASSRAGSAAAGGDHRGPRHHRSPVANQE